MYKEIDDCNLKFIDNVALKRFIMKCGVIPSTKQVLAIIRRLDIDADARLSKKEFFEGIIPHEAFTKGTLFEFKNALKGGQGVFEKTT